MIKENPLCQNLTIGKRGRPKNADKILKEKSKRQKVAEEEPPSAPRAAVRHEEPGPHVDIVDVGGKDLEPHGEARVPRDPDPNPAVGGVEGKNDSLDL